MELPNIKSKEVRELGIREVFRFGILAKGIGATFETLVGALLLWSGDTVQFVLELINNELIDDPDGFFGSHFHTLLAPTHEGQVFGGLYLLSHGVVKLFMLVGLWLNKLWAYPASLALFSLFILYQMVRYTSTHSTWLLVLTVLDLIMMWLIWHEYHERLKADGTL